MYNLPLGMSSADRDLAADEPITTMKPIHKNYKETVSMFGAQTSK